MISHGLSLQWFRVGLGFPARDWAGSQQYKHQILATRPVVSDGCRKEFPQRRKVVKQVTYVAGGKEYDTCRRPHE